ncbi:histidine kinase [Streptococcus pneumoniae]|nr:histidine kinase [Streptococcus pneumoniae]
MKLKSYILVGYIISTLLTILVVFWAVQKMLIAKGEIYFLLGMTIVASLVGAGISLFLLLPVFTSLGKLKEHAKRVAAKDFPSNLEVQGPVEFQQLGQTFNEMSHDLQVSFDSLEESEREKGLMIAQLSHDIKTPITSIQATVEGILDGIIKESEQAHYLATIGRQTERLNKLVEELNFLTLNTARNQVETTSKDSIFLDKLLIECMSEFQFLIEQERRDVHLQVIPESARIEGDYAKLSRILVNLVDNAFKYSAPGTKLEVVTKLEKGQLSISVTDEGQGIAPEDLENIFKRLYRVETSRNMKTGGHGLGLAIARELAHQLGGEITVSSQYGLGSTFTLVLNLSGSENKAPNFKLKLATQKKFTWRLVVQAFFRVVVNPIFDKSYFFRSRFLGSFR